MPAFEENPTALRETLEAAATAAEAASPPSDAPAPASTPAEAAPAPAAPYLGSSPAPSPAPKPAEATPPVTSPVAAPAPVVDASAALAPITEPPAPQGNHQQLEKAPGSWNPVAREQWTAVPPEIRQEVWKREREVSRALTVSTEARKWQDDFNKTMQPYLGFIAAENSTPLQAVNNMMQTAAALRVGTPDQKVNLVAQVIKQFGVDLQMLDSVLAGQQAQARPEDIIAREVDRRLAPIHQHFQQQSTFREQQFQQQVDNDLMAFATAANEDGTPKHEFFQDVGDIMADLVEVATRRGQSLSLTDAYERAIMMHEPVRRVIEARKQRQSATQLTTAATHAKGAAVSVTPSTEVVTAVPVPGNSLRAAIEASIAAQQGR